MLVNNYVARYVVVLLPATAFVVGWLIFNNMRPIYAGVRLYDYDPAYVFLFNGLNILRGFAPGHVDHPGTPLQVIVGVITLIRWVALRALHLSDADLVESVLREPEGYIAAASAVLLALNCAALACLGQRVFAITGDLKLTVLTQSAPLLFAIAIPRMVYLSPEAIVFGASLFLLSVLATGILQPDTSSSVRTAVLAGIICGVAAATKITFLPVAGLLLLLRPRSRIAYALLAMLGSFLLALSPIRSAVGQAVNWFVELAWHTGHYGSGAGGIMDFAVVPERLAALWKHLPVFFICLAGLVLLFVAAVMKPILAKDQRGDVRVAVPGIFLLVSVVQLAAVLKHYGTHYLLPALPVLGVGVVWVAWLTALRGRPKWRTVLTDIALIAVLGYATHTAIVELREFEVERAIRDQDARTLEHAAANYPNAIIVGTYRVGLPSYAKLFGLEWTRGAHEQTALRISQGETAYNPWNQKFHVLGRGWTEIGYVDELTSTGNTVLLLAPKDLDLSLFMAEKVADIGQESLYRILGSRNAVTQARPIPMR